MPLSGAKPGTSEQRERELALTRAASHELRSPLTVIKLATDVLIADGECDGSMQRKLERIRKATCEMESLIDAFLILSRDSGSGDLVEEFLVNTVLREELERALPLLDGRPVAVRVEEHCQLLLHAPARVVGVVLGHLLRNACLYTISGSISVTIAADGVRIADTGIGMDAEQCEHAFEAYYCSLQGAGGCGVGLAVVKRLADHFGWPVQLDSEPGRGTTVHISFPQAQPHP